MSDQPHDLLLKAAEIMKTGCFAASILSLRQTVIYLLEGGTVTHTAMKYFRYRSTKSFKIKFMFAGISAMWAKWVERPTHNTDEGIPRYHSETVLQNTMRQFVSADPYYDEQLILAGKAISCGLFTVTFASLAFLGSIVEVAVKVYHVIF
ncbi:hypothetical protein FO488_13665 [Geobacter sp. FeAm09]|uniref:hypothetical protein n=1 Tax=Geobacter sp. FeAm09 TaxID=2597769 RepID=UPI0011EF22E0|nr:hypothetical protein [Geobacter sp. FeAm09]QEM69105.1 hypothetical protein FO488_13665 [Geobacter sp. FeAm09]